MGGDKALVELDGSLLIERPLAALRAAGIEEVVVVAKRETVLPLGTTVWLEPDEPRHPLTGLVHALRTADGPVFVVAADLALLDAATVARVLGAAQPDDLAVVPDAGGRLQPLCALYAPAAFEPLAAADPSGSLTAAVASLVPRVVVFDDDTPFFNVNTPEDLARVSRRS
jgi:molybdopterin-guanine dinucleotide biosynthesis protein A